MGYYCDCVDREIFIKKENIELALEKLADSDYGMYLDNYPPETIKEILAGDYWEAKLFLFEDFLLDNGYSPVFDAEGNVVDLYHEGEKWHNDTCFFDVFAEAVEKGSYIEMVGEDNSRWRMVFDGKCCFEIEPVIAWPEYDELIKEISSEVLKKPSFDEQLQAAIGMAKSQLDIETNDKGSSVER